MGKIYIGLVVMVIVTMGDVSSWWFADTVSILDFLTQLLFSYYMHPLQADQLKSPSYAPVEPVLAELLGWLLTLLLQHALFSIFFRHNDLNLIATDEKNSLLWSC